MAFTESDLETILYNDIEEPRALPFSFLENITHGFSDNMITGKGGFAVVYKGILNNGGLVAVKRMSSMYTYDELFLGEVECLMKLKHKNIVRLLGYCAHTKGSMAMYKGKLVMAETRQRLLCFEYLPKGCLEDYIHDSSGGLEWTKRYKIIKGICEALKYLQDRKIVHLDLKPTNILLDENMIPKIADFGNSRCLEEEQTSVIATEVCGTRGYLAPEYVIYNKITYKSDVYSLGVIINEILTGKKGYEPVDNILTKWSHRTDRTQRVQIQVCAEIGTECTDYNPDRRPVSMNHIIDRLLRTESTQVIPADGTSELLVIQKLALYFPFEPNKITTCTLQLTNNTNKKVAFRLVHKSGESFIRLPLYGIVLPMLLHTLIVTTQESEELPRKSDMDLILESAILMDDYINTFRSQPDTFFSKAKKKGNVVQEVTLKAFYTPRPEKIDVSKCMLFEEGTKPKALPFSLLEDITDGFSDKLLIGRGRSAVVYKGMLANGSAVAVKRLSDTYSDTEFQSEVECLMKVKHKNIVQFLGYCADIKGIMHLYNGELIMEDKRERLLCFEYLPKGSLENYIKDYSGGLEWSMQYKIIKGICEGLNYLHQEYIMHLDLKAANILLDEVMVPKIIVFGQLRRLEEKQTHIISTKMVETIGYMAPEVSNCKDEEITLKSDMFSLGLIIIEILSMNRISSYDVENEFESRGNMTDRLLWEQLRLCTEIGSECTRIDQSERPMSMKHILDRLIETEITKMKPARRPCLGNEMPHGEMIDLSTAAQCDGDKGEDMGGNSTHLLNKTTNRVKRAAEEWMAQHPLVGRRTELNDLRQCTSNALVNSIQVISVWGLAGVGKSALLKNLLCDRILSDCGLLERNKYGLFDKYGWVDVSYPFNLKDFSRSLLMSFHSQSLQDNTDHVIDTMGSENPIVECRGIMRKHRCLIIIDDLRSTEELDLIRAELVSVSSLICIIGITTGAIISRNSRGNRGEIMFNVKCLQADAAFYLFQNEVSRKYPFPLGDSAELQELTSKCGGLPKVIVEIAGLLAKKSVGRMDDARSINDNFIHDLENNREFHNLQGLFSWMRTYLRNCPDSLKPCIFYLSIFPRDRIIRRRRLVRRWIAEGYSRDSAEESAEENGENLFSNLLDLSIIQQAPQMLSTTKLRDTRMISFTVNGFMREYISSRQMAENLVFELGGRSIIATEPMGRHLVILQSWERDITVFERIDFSQLWSLTVFGEWRSFFISESINLLRVLDLEDSSGNVKDEDLEKIVRLLSGLKFLSLRGRREILRLPNMLGHLRQLQTLDVRGTSIVSLPKNITKLKKLQYIRAGNTDIPASAPPRNIISCWFSKHRSIVGVEVPRGIGQLTALHTLGVVNVAASGTKKFLENLKKLTQLRKLGVSGINRKNSCKFFRAIKGHVHMESLSVLLDKNNGHLCCLKKVKNKRGCSDDMIFPLCTNLRSLKLYGLVDKLPNWKADKLTKLELKISSLTQDGIEILGRLPELCILRVKELQDGHLHFRVIVHNQENSSYEKVKVLEIACSSEELFVSFGSKTMKELELLKVDCPSASSNFKLSGMRNLEELKLVEIVQGPNAETQKKHLCHQLDEHPNDNKPVVKLEVAPRSF